MKHLIKLSLSALLFGIASECTQAQSIKNLDFLIGTWHVHEVVLPDSPHSWTESGVRTCSYYLGDQLIKCEAKTKVDKTGREREYVYLINYVEDGDYFNATSLASDFPYTGIYRWFLNDSKDTIQFVNPKAVQDDRFFRGTIILENPNKVTWNGWASKYGGDGSWSHRIREVATRRK